ncbi:MAG: phosphoadenosine phosphosulfate reductase family protein [bacterium]
MNNNILKTRQAYDLDLKIMFSKQRIEEFYIKMHGKVYISFSGGKDSTVLLHLVRSIYPKVPAVFVDTGLEYPEIREFVKSIDNVIWLKPEMNFRRVLEKYGYPVISKENALKIRQAQTLDKKSHSYILRMEGIKSNGDISKIGKIPEKWKYLVESDIPISEKCCDVIKKKPIHKFEKESELKGFIGTMASDSRIRKISYNRTGCNSFLQGKEKSQPLGFWLEEDIWDYIKEFNIPYSKIYDMGYSRTGCMFCMFGVHMEKEPNRFQRMQKTHPKQYDYCMNKLGCKKILKILGVNYKNKTPLF